ncbi:MAG TPA: MFS transporter [Euzebyales bacterium]|nr:MFS transporter [Euzebyales bacterium]
MRLTGQAAALVDLLGRNRDFRHLFLASVVSLCGDWFAYVAVSGLVIDDTGRAGAGALVFAASVLPVFVAAPIAGVVADRVDRKRLMIAADLLRVLPALGLLAADAWHLPLLALLCVASIAALSAFFEPVTAAVLPNLVAQRDLSLAQSTMGAVWGSMLFVGAAIGGLVAAGLGRPASFVLNAATFALSAVLVWRVRSPFQRRRTVAAPPPWRALADVWGFVRPRKISRTLLVTKAGVGVGNGLVGLLPAYALSVFGAGDLGIGVLVAARGLGAFVGPFIARPLVRDSGHRLVAAVGISIVAYGLCYLLLPSATSMALATVCVVCAHSGGGAQWMLSTYGLQVTTPDALRGRVMSADFGLATLAMGVSSLIAGALTEVIGLRATSWALSSVAVAAGLAWLWWARDLWSAPRDPLIPAPEDLGAG